MRWVLTLLAWLASLAVLAPVCFAGVILLAGPHSSLLAPSLQVPVVLLGWGILLMGPLWVARTVWRRVGDGQSDG